MRVVGEVAGPPAQDPLDVVGQVRVVKFTDHLGCHMGLDLEIYVANMCVMWLGSRNRRGPAWM